MALMFDVLLTFMLPLTADTNSRSDMRNWTIVPPVFTHGM